MCKLCYVFIYDALEVSVAFHFAKPAKIKRIAQYLQLVTKEMNRGLTKIILDSHKYKNTINLLKYFDVEQKIFVLLSTFPHLKEMFDYLHDMLVDAGAAKAEEIANWLFETFTDIFRVLLEVHKGHTIISTPVVPVVPVINEEPVSHDHVVLYIPASAEIKYPQRGYLI